MDCDQYLELMSSALDGECTAEERRQLDDHLAVCPECAELFAVLSVNADAMRGLDCEVPADLKSRIMANLPEQEKPVKKGKVIHWKRWVPVAAAACLVLVVSLLPRGGSRANETAPASPEAPMPSSVMESYVTDSSLEYSMGGYPAEPAEVPQVTGESASSDGTIPMEPSPDRPDSTVAATNEPDHYAFENQRSIRVSYGATPAPCALIIGSTDSLANYLAQFGSMSFDSEGNPVPIPEIEKLKAAYTEDFFRSCRLLCVVVESGSGSNRFELASQGLYRDAVTVLAHIPEVGTCDMAAWLLVAEVDTMFDDGDTLEVTIEQING